MKNRWIITAVVVGLLLSGTSFAQAGQDLYQKKMCAACHGPGKKGGDLKDSKMDKAAMTKFLKDPKSVKPVAMPAFKGTDEELGALVDYLLGLRK